MYYEQCSQFPFYTICNYVLFDIREKGTSSSLYVRCPLLHVRPTIEANTVCTPSAGTTRGPPVAWLQGPVLTCSCGQGLPATQISLSQDCASSCLSSNSRCQFPVSLRTIQTSQSHPHAGTSGHLTPLILQSLHPLAVHCVNKCTPGVPV